jgi:hypothetical protein
MVIGLMWTTESAVITCSFLMCFIAWVVLKVIREELKRPAYLHRSSIIDPGPLAYGVERSEDDAKYCMEAGRTYWLARYQREGLISINPSDQRELEFAEALRRSHVEKRCDHELCYFCLLRERQAPYL